jgi:translation initiation factor IF-2
VLGHVDHGKTSLLDKIRSANVAAGEAGGITQHIGAYTVKITGSDGKPKRVTFLDTPGHQAFTAMRARGANMTDVVVLVVAADDGVMPQTVESINHAKATGVPIVVAMNKIDKPEARPDRVLGQLAENGLNPSEWGGDTEVVRTSATTGQGVRELIEYLDYVASLRELKASPSLPASGRVIEAFMDPNRGAVARVLIQDGTLRIGDAMVCGSTSGRVRSISDDKGQVMREAGPATPVEVIGLDAAPAAGESFYIVNDISRAKAIAEEQAVAQRESEIARRSKVTLDNLFETIKQGEVRELNVILKADVQGSVDVLRKVVTEELSKEVQVKLLHAAVGGITESDVLLAEASGAMIIGFSVAPDEAARKLAERTGVDIRLYRIIYEISEDIRKALAGMLSPEKQEQVVGRAEIRKVIRVTKIGSIAGCMVTDGALNRSNKYRLIRDGVVVVENLALDSLKRFKDDVKEVRSGMECGLKLAGYDDVKVGDRLEAYKTIDVARTR